MLTLRLRGETQVTSSPWSSTRPASGCSKPAIIRSDVVLPQPDGPSIEKNSPPRIVNETSFTATTAPKRFVTRSNLISPSCGGSLTIHHLPSRRRSRTCR